MVINVTPQTIITFASLLSAVVVIVLYIKRAVHWFDNQQAQDVKIKALEEKHEADMKIIQEEQTLIVFGLLACLKGLQEKGCNGPVTAAAEKLEKHLNNKAHNM